VSFSLTLESAVGRWFDSIPSALPDLMIIIKVSESNYRFFQMLHGEKRANLIDDVIIG
jgi:hypothetical protein